MSSLVDRQRTVCERFGARFYAAPDALKVGISGGVREGVEPIHGLRHPPAGDTTGWYIWSGDYSEAADFFLPLHVGHLPQRCPAVLPYLGLPPGWRFLIAPGHEDVWFDESLLGAPPELERLRKKRKS